MDGPPQGPTATQQDHPPEHRQASTLCVHQLGDIHHGGDQGPTGSNSLGIPGKGLQACADLSHWLRVHICTPG